MMIQDFDSRAGFRFSLSRRAWLLIGLCLAGLIFLSTLQTTINGAVSGYTIDTGEIQNALPRWGTLHWPGYPQYSFVGSLLVTGFRLGGIPPAVGASLVSTLWGLVAVGLLVLLAYELEVPGPAALVGALAFALAKSVWMDASLAEVHTLTMTFTLATVYFAWRFGQRGRRRDLLWLTLALSQGVIHQRSLLFAVPGVAVLIAPRWRAVLRQGLHLIPLAALAPLTYLYIQIRTWMGGEWIFSQLVRSRRNLWEMLVDNQAKRLLKVPTEMSVWQERSERFLAVLADDLPLPLVILGLAALFCLLWRQSRRQALGLTLIWLPYGLVGVLMWKPYVGDALLAVKLPLLMMAGLGLASLTARTSRWLDGRRLERGLRVAGVTLLLLGFVLLFVNHRPKITAVTHNSASLWAIPLAERVEPLIDPGSPPLVTLWGSQYWALSYAQAYVGRLPGLKFVNHLSDLQEVFDRHGQLWTLSAVFYRQPVSLLERKVGQRLFLSSLAPGVVRLAAEPQIEPAGSSVEPILDLENGLEIVSASLTRRPDDSWWLQVVWRARDELTQEYGVVVQVVAHNPPRHAQDFLKLIYAPHPVGGWYPTDRWVVGEVVSDHYLIQLAPDSQPVAVRVALRRAYPYLDTTPWLSLPVSNSTGF